MRIATQILVAMLLTTGAAAHELKVATWNIEHLRDGIGEGPNPRDQADFDRLEACAEILDADVIAFQEVENQTAAERVFDPAVYQIFISNRNHTQRTGLEVQKASRRCATATSRPSGCPRYLARRPLPVPFAMP